MTKEEPKKEIWEISKSQQIENDIPREPTWTIRKDARYSHESFYGLTLEEMKELRQKLIDLTL